MQLVVSNFDFGTVHYTESYSSSVFLGVFKNIITACREQQRYLPRQGKEYFISLHSAERLRLL